MKAEQDDLVVRALTPSRWPHFEALFGERGACGGCWCMLWRLPNPQFEAQKGSKNRRAMKRLVDGGSRPGLLSYRNKQAVGWCSLAPRIEFPALSRSRLFKPIDELPVWSVTCLFVDRQHRRSGVSVALLRAAIEFVGKQRGRAVEGYPQQPKKAAMADVFAWNGIASAYLAAGFYEAARPSPTRRIMRYVF